MKSSISNNTELSKYKLLAFSLLIIATTYILSDFIQWYINRDKFVLGLNQMPLYRRFLTDLYIILLGYGGYLLLRKNSKSWDLIIISMTSIIPSFVIIPLVWGVLYYTNWLEDFPFLLWYAFSVVMVVYLIIKRKDFKINNWVGKFSLILLVNIGIRLLHEIIIFYLTKA